jgi:hypothetical protein
LSAALSGTCGSQHSGGTRDTATQHLTGLSEHFRVRLRHLLPGAAQVADWTHPATGFGKDSGNHLLAFGWVSNYTAILQGLAVQKGTARSLSPGVHVPCG